MKSISSFSWLSLLSLLLISCVNSEKAHHENFVDCLESRITNPDDDVIYTQSDTDYESVLLSTFNNLRFVNDSSILKPTAIVTPLHESQIQAAIFCSKKHGLQIRTRSGGHDNEGLSYISQTPFVVIDLQNLTAVSIDVEEKTAWVEPGATLGMFYHAIAQKSRTLGFPAASCATVGVGGHLTGGGVSLMSRKFGLASDNIIDAKIIDVDGRILDRESMGEDLFWAIRGGGAVSFGVIIAYKVSLSTVPEMVTVFTVTKTLEQNATQLVHRWQFIADKIDENLVTRIFMYSVKSNLTGSRTIQASFVSMFVGGIEDLLQVMARSFPELGLTREDCIEMSWIESILYFAQIPRNESIDVLLSRNLPLSKLYFKGKSDFVTTPIPENGLQGIWRLLHEEDENVGQVQFTALGGKIAQISESETPFPHRAGNIYLIGYSAGWGAQSNSEVSRHINWTRKLQSYLTPYVSKNPRRAYLNYRDLDLGVNNIIGYTSYRQASKWGKQYFKNNFDRLVQVKTKVDPTNFFRNEQSIPSLAPY